MTLTRITINPDHPAAANDLKNPYSMHQTIERITENNPENAPTKALWRIDHNPNTNQTHLTIQTHNPPDTTQLPPKYFSNQLTRTNDQLIINNITPNTTLAFRVRANPNVTIRGVRRGIYDELKQIEWLVKRLNANGVLVCDVHVTDSARVTFFKRNDAKRKSGGCITLASASFEGTLTVDDVDQFRSLICRGIGRAFAFGFGLLTVSRLR